MFAYLRAGSAKISMLTTAVRKYCKKRSAPYTMYGGSRGYESTDAPKAIRTLNFFVELGVTDTP